MSEIMPSDCGTCDGCGYWRRSRDPDMHGGHCRRYPPTIRASDGQSQFPATEARDWCGEFVRFGKRRRP